MACPGGGRRFPAPSRHTQGPAWTRSPRPPSARDWSGPLDTFFKITERGSTVGREVRGGVVTFFTMAYIIVLNPIILGFAKDGDGKFLGGGTRRTSR